MGILIKIAVNAVALWVAAWLLPGISFGAGKFGSKFATVILVALVFGLVNAVVKPIAKFLSFPFIILTLGLFTFVVNAFMLQLTEWIAEPLGLSFTIRHFFWDAVIGAVVITVVSMILHWVIPDSDE
ncbi:phage holin family protein [Nostocoides sp. HKS02]|uniref:phage holin family protein n=1 Tax=Nostocoides sp. HKS02 TaxID=1813880 RepID=UPI0012B4BA57|nr:phage holin family protein [Tetrasphaera sp. HKS02]QGN58573.1 phage holin family protein [Tetrasphaera sp. HKS02]